MAEGIEERFELRLYVAGQTQRSVSALANLRSYCQEYLKDNYHVEVIDLLLHPELAERDQIVAIPTLIRKMPLPVRKIIGDLSNRDKVLEGLNLKIVAG